MKGRFLGNLFQWMMSIFTWVVGVVPVVVIVVWKKTVFLVFKSVCKKTFYYLCPWKWHSDVPSPRHRGKKLALAIIQTFRNLQVKEQHKRMMVTLTSCGRFLSFVLGFLQVPWTLDGDSSTFCVPGTCGKIFVYWPSALIDIKLMHHGKRQFI